MNPHWMADTRYGQQKAHRDIDGPIRYWWDYFRIGFCLADAESQCRDESKEGRLAERITTTLYAFVIVAALLPGAAFSQTAEININIIQNTERGCVIEMSSPVQLHRWRAYKDGLLWRQRKGPADQPWPAAMSFTCAEVQISPTVQALAEYIIWDHDADTVCMEVAGVCP